MIRTLAATLAVAAILAPPVAAHGDGGSRGFRSTVTAVQPSLAGLVAEIRDADDRLFVRNETGRPLVVFGYSGEPYLRFADGAVYRNGNSPATYLNEERYAGVPVPEEATPKAAPRWERVADEPAYEWHDHRIHWMSRSDPPKVRRNPDLAQRLFTWTVPGRIENQPVAIRGRLDYTPPPDTGPKPWHFASLGILVLVAAVAGVWRLRRKREGSL
ncbi:MAG TPA: hypothetical protein VH968_12690 [Gaiellaceae bacterium]